MKLTAAAFQIRYRAHLAAVLREISFVGTFSWASIGSAVVSFALKSLHGLLHLAVCKRELREDTSKNKALAVTGSCAKQACDFQAAVGESLFKSRLGIFDLAAPRNMSPGSP